MLYIAAGLVLFGLIYYIRRYFSRNPEIAKKTYKLFILLISIIGVLFLLRAGLPILATILGGIVALYPKIGKLTQLIYLYNSAGNIFKKKHTQNSCNKNTSNMSVKEACEILGVEKNATKQEIETAYKKNMVNNHPDKGGSKYLASQVNQARDVLMKRIKS